MDAAKVTLAVARIGVHEYMRCPKCGGYSFDSDDRSNSKKVSALQL
jgi:hypothetical protein